MTKVSTSNQGEWNLRDLFRGFITAVIGAILGVIYPMIENGQVFDADGNFLLKWKVIAIAAGSAGLSYLLNNLKDKSKVVITADSKAQALAIKEQVLEKVV